jgi:aldehyde dehydrogenase (NAD+)
MDPLVRQVFSELHLSPGQVIQGTFASRSGWLPGAGSLTLPVHNPATGEIIAQVEPTDPDDYERLLEESRAIGEKWRSIPAPRRGEAIRLIGEALRTHKEALGSLVSLEVGKIKAEGSGEVQEMIDMADFSLGQSRMLYGRTLVSERPEHRMMEQWHPLGVVGIVTAFNFPVAVYSWNAFLAAICGNTVIWKPSPKGMLSAIAVQKIVIDVLSKNQFPQFSSLMIDHENRLAERFCADPRLGLLSFTGSTAVGRKVSEIRAAQLGRSLMELGGNNAVLVDETADLDLAVPSIVFGAVGTAGQRCTTTRRLIVAEEIAKPLLDRLVLAYRQIRIGHPLDPATLMGPLIDEPAVERYLAVIEELKRLGAKILYGGRRIEGPGHFVEPTLVEASPDWPLVRRETFAPILYVLTFRQFEEAIRLQNAVPQGLSSALFTTNLRRAELFLSSRGSDCGIANINIGTSGAEIGGAFGGEKETGGGREAGTDAWKNYMRRQTNTINWSRELPLAQGIRFRVDRNQPD